MTIEINIARDFTDKPIGRYRTDGPYSGEVFREDVLMPSLEKDEVIVVLDGTRGYPSSFLEEAFGGLARTGRWNAKELQQRLCLRAVSQEYMPYRDRALDYIAKFGR